MQAADVLALPACVDAAAAARLWRELGASAPAAVDFSAVREIDSAGLAFVVAVRRRGGPDHAARLLHVPQRFAQLCAAHRIDKELLP